MCFKLSENNKWKTSENNSVEGAQGARNKTLSEKKGKSEKDRYCGICCSTRKGPLSNQNWDNADGLARTCAG